MGQTLYAQGSGNASEIAWNTVANGSGSSVAWGSHATDDTLDANGYTVAIDTNGWTRAALVTIQAGGGFTIDMTSEARAFTANIGSAAFTSSTTVLTTDGDGNTLGITGNVYGGLGANDYGLDPVSMNAATITITGNVYGGAAGTAFGINRMGIGGTLVVTGSANGGSAGAAIQAGYRATITVGSLKAGADVVAIIHYASYYTVITSGTVECSAEGTFPLASVVYGVRLRMTGIASGQQMKVRDNSGTPAEKILKVPDYPAEADVEDGVAFDYTTKTGSYPTTATTEAAQKATDAAFLETNKDEIIPDDTDILAEFGVTGTAVVGGGGGPLVGSSALISG